MLIKNEEWYRKRSSNPAGERMRIVEMAANIVLEDIRSEIYDKKNHQIFDSKEENLHKGIPENFYIL